MEEPLPSNDQIVASAVRFLIDGHEEEAASLLLACSFDIRPYESWPDVTYYAVDLGGPRAVYDIIKEETHPITMAISTAINAVLPIGYYVKSLFPRGQIISIDPNWHKELLEIARGKGVHNQLSDDKALYTWRNLRFRSKSEVRIAEALEKVGVLFLPNCLARLGVLSKRETREPDFLVCFEGKWGILEVDGEPFHPPSRTVEDHERDRLFRQHGIRVVEHFDAHRCYEDPEKVVQDFLNLLKNQA